MREGCESEMQRYFVPVESYKQEQLAITGDDAHHLANVMRAKPGETVIISDGDGREALAKLVTVDKAEVTAEVSERRNSISEPMVRVVIAQALPKGDKLEMVIQKGTEIGAFRFIPFVSERTIVQYDAKKEAKRMDRWSKIAKEAAEQAHRGRVPVIESVISWRELLKKAMEADASYFCYEKESALQLRSMLSKLRLERGEQAEIMLIIGPEGGFTEKEAREAEEAGCVPVSLGRRILRTETASLVGLSAILYEYGEIGG
jgi:16S rRNA (uracil1498-N3)-methyltransferase